MSAIRTIEQLQKQVSTYRVMALLIPLVIVFGAIIASFTADKQITTYLRQKQESMTNSQSQIETSDFNAFIAAHETDLEKVDYAIPNESMMVSVIQDIESLINTYDPTGSIKFASTTPVRAGIDLTIPVTIRVKMPKDDIPLFIEKMLALPYGLQMLTSDSQITNDGADCTFSMRLYVQEPFTGI
jgi:hypothetical protein